MAMITCPECGKQISDKAGTCPNCGCPIADCSPSGEVRIKFSPVKSPSGLNGNQSVSLFAGSRTLWEGKSGEVAKIHFDGPTQVTVKYHLSMMHYGGECSGTINPAESKKYNVSARQGVFSSKLVLQPVDVFDSD